MFHSDNKDPPKEDGKKRVLENTLRPPDAERGVPNTAPLHAMGWGPQASILAYFSCAFFLSPLPVPEARPQEPY